MDVPARYRALAARGLDSFGVDPRAPAAQRLIRKRIEHAAELGERDAIMAVMASWP